MSSDDDMDIISSSSEDEDGEELELFLESTDDNEEDRNSEKGDESNDEEFNLGDSNQNNTFAEDVATIDLCESNSNNNNKDIASMWEGQQLFPPNSRKLKILQSYGKVALSKLMENLFLISICGKCGKKVPYQSSPGYFRR